VIGIDNIPNEINGDGVYENRSIKRASTMDDTNMIKKAMNMVAKKNSLEPSNCPSFPSISDSNIVSRIANLGVSMGRVIMFLLPLLET
jgi:hypothetical protein